MTKGSDEKIGDSGFVAVALLDFGCAACDYRPVSDSKAVREDAETMADS